MSYISQSTKNNTWDRVFPAINNTSVWILSIGRKEPTTDQQVLEAIKIQKLTVKYNKVCVITDRRYNKIVRTNIQENRYIFNKIRHIQSIYNNRIILP